ncbi:ThiF family adenylyltransferase [Dethiosulfovibrio salsuginis]|uniref:Integrative and conjugative element protein, VC0181 family n=1 Tax=Dethiosulfovibrio salsuginis TaxID=561720 RepID=A0A1X7K799_9BACT|nr:ThiF family adenylyltransferase [Dethiosulfovibrio salsuginis]SMG36937.1 integrative and conjugative element protein, VC0181 family [Dethiosulfovibrio salsuginis]
MSISVQFDPKAWKKILREASREDDLETGGILIGHIDVDEEGTTVTVHRSCIKPIRRERACYSPDMAYARERVDYYGREKGWIYLGEWHRHPGSLNTLSEIDRRTAREILEEEDHQLLVLPIVTRAGSKVQIDLYVATLEEGNLKISHLWTAREDEKNTEEASGMTKLYVDENWVREFVHSNAMTAVYRGRWNKDESFVFLPLPGDQNGLIKFIRGVESIPVPAHPNQVTAVLFDSGDIRFYGIEEGEVAELSPTYVDPEEDVYSRNLGLLETIELRDKAVMMVGCGSLGSAMAMELARAGVGTIYLMDPDILEPHNLSRHQCGLKDLGRLKVDALKDRVMEICPSLNVLACPLDVVEDQRSMETTMDIAKDCDLLICTTDTDSSRAFVNDMTIQLGKPSLQVGLHERAHSGIVQVIRPKEGACFMCHRRTTLDQGAQRNEAFAYSDADSVRDVTIQPGLSAQIGVVAEVGTVRAIDILCRDDDEDQDQKSLPPLTVVYVSRSDEEGLGRPQLRFAHYDLEAVDDCPACGNDDLPLNLDDYLQEDTEQEINIGLAQD